MITAFWKYEQYGEWIGKVECHAEIGRLMAFLLQGSGATKANQGMEKVSHFYSSKDHGEEPKSLGDLLARKSKREDDANTLVCIFPNTSSLFPECPQHFLQP